LPIKPLDPLATADGLNFEADLPELLSINDESAIKDEGGLVHALVYASPVDIAELFPFSGNDDGLGALAGLKSRCRDGHLLFD
jgi:hypothetical protein